MNGPIALLGSASWSNGLRELNQQLLAGSQSRRPHVVCLSPVTLAAAGNRNLSQFAQVMSERFELLGARVTVAPPVERGPWHERHWSDLIRSADLIYLQDLHPEDFRRTSIHSPVWTAIIEHWQNGAMIVSSAVAAAIVLAPFGPTQIRHFKIVAALGLVPHICLWPHFNRSLSKRGLTLVTDYLATHNMNALGINENTALLGHVGEQWQVIGTESVSVITPDTSTSYVSGQRLTLPVAKPRNLPLLS